MEGIAIDAELGGRFHLHTITGQHDLLDQLALDAADQVIVEPAILITAEGDEELVRAALQAGIVDHWVKDTSPPFLQGLSKRIREALSRQHLTKFNKLLLTALGATQDAILVTDAQGRIQYVNPAVEAMSGYTRDELLGKNPRLLIDEPSSSEVFDDLWRTILARSSWSGELTVRPKAGRFLLVSVTASPVADEHGQLIGFMSIQRDISQRKFFESQLLQAEKMQSIRTLAGGIAHEFNNLLTGINGYATLGLGEAGLPAQATSSYQKILDLTERAATLTKQLLLYARKPFLVRKSTQLRELLQQAATDLWNTKHLKIELDLPAPDAPEFRVEADPDRLQQALVQLALNARDAQGGVGSIVFRMRQLKLESAQTAFPENILPGEYVLVEVVDYGVGMTPEVLSKALDPFFTTKPVGQGTGMGLPSVLGIVRAHHGYLTLETRAGSGTTVGMYFPRYVESPKKRRRRASFLPGQVIEPETSPGRQILLVDDEDSVRDVLKRFLETAGQQVHCAGDVQEALAEIGGSVDLDLLILDPIAPPDATILMLEQWRARYPKGPVLFCSGQSILQAHRKLLELGPYTLIQKPFRMNELWYSVQQALSAAAPSK